MQDSKIEWTTHTLNPWRGCTKVSAGCANCYAETLSHRNPGTLGVWGPKGTRVVAAESAWREPLKWEKLAQQAFVNAKMAGEPAPERPRVFCASLADVFEDWKGGMTGSGKDAEPGQLAIDDARTRLMTMADVRRRLFELIDRTPNLDWLLLTKRPENVLTMLDEISNGQGDAWNLRDHMKNVWLGTSVENQQTADERIPHLLKVPAAVRFLSCEPLLGPVDLLSVAWPDTDMGPKHRVDVLRFGCWLRHPDVGIGRVAQVGEQKSANGFVSHSNMHDDYGKIGWVIVGGESGHGARPMHIEWARSIVEQCKAAGVKCFVKQLGSNPEGDPVIPPRDNGDGTKTITVMQHLEIRDRKGGDMDEWPEDLRVREFPAEEPPC